MHEDLLREREGFGDWTVIDASPVLVAMRHHEGAILHVTIERGRAVSCELFEGDDARRIDPAWSGELAVDAAALAYQAVLARPLDDAPRRAFADAIRQTEPERAELIDVQLELTRSGLAGDRRRELDQRATDLLRRNAAVWAAPVLGLTRFTSFRRGFIEGVTVSAPELLKIARTLFARAPVIDIAVLDARVVAERLFASGHLARLRMLRLANGGLGDAEIQLLAASSALGQLYGLDLSGNQIGASGMEALAASPHLAAVRWIGLGGNRAADPTPHFDYDGEAIVQEVRPPEGAALVARHGPRPWLTNAIAWPGPVPPLELLAG